MFVTSVKNKIKIHVCYDKIDKKVSPFVRTVVTIKLEEKLWNSYHTKAMIK
jgi:hypothetical protein